MKPLSVLVSTVAVVMGVGGGAVAYQSVSTNAPEATAMDHPATSSSPAAVVERPEVKHRFAPCKPPSVRKGKSCVLHVVKTVVVPASNSSPGPSSGSGTSDEATAQAPDNDSYRDHDKGEEETHQPEATHEEEADDHEAEHETEPGDHEEDDD